jgi:hypothetical protein
MTHSTDKQSAEPEPTEGMEISKSADYSRWKYCIGAEPKLLTGFKSGRDYLFNSTISKDHALTK